MSKTIHKLLNERFARRLREENLTEDDTLIAVVVKAYFDSKHKCEALEKRIGLVRKDLEELARAYARLYQDLREPPDMLHGEFPTRYPELRDWWINLLGDSQEILDRWYEGSARPQMNKPKAHRGYPKLMDGPTCVVPDEYKEKYTDVPRKQENQCPSS